MSVTKNKILKSHTCIYLETEKKEMYCALPYHSYSISFFSLVLFDKRVYLKLW